MDRVSAGQDTDINRITGSSVGMETKFSPTVLVVEDNVLMRKLFLRCLEDAGYNAIEISDPRRLLSSMRDIHPDLVLLDIMMPEVSGLELIRDIRSDSELKAIPTVAVTSLATSADRRRLLDAGFDGHITKPIKPKEFAALLSPFVDRSTAGMAI